MFAALFLFYEKNYISPQVRQAILDDRVGRCAVHLKHTSPHTVLERLHSYSFGRSTRMRLFRNISAYLCPLIVTRKYFNLAKIYFQRLEDVCLLLRCFTSFQCIIDAGVGLPLHLTGTRTLLSQSLVCTYTGTFSCRAQPASPSSTLGSRSQFRPQDLSKLS